MLVPSLSLHSSPIFASKVGCLTRLGVLQGGVSYKVGCLTRWGVLQGGVSYKVGCLTYKYHGRDKHPSLFCRNVNDEEKIFYDIYP